jgi:VRR-NUC domain
MFSRIALRKGPRYHDMRGAELPPITERRFQQQVLDLAHLHKWRTYHTWNSMHSTGGFPDLVLVRGQRLVFVEVKTDSKRSKPSSLQTEWLDALAYTCAEVYTWRPSNWVEITRVLR